MPITIFLDGYKPDPETKRVMGVAFEMARAALRLEDRDDPAVAILAMQIIALAKEGERNPDLLCERVLKDLPRVMGPPRPITNGSNLLPPASPPARSGSSS